jgi:hypothetical protein
MGFTAGERQIAVVRRDRADVYERLSVAPPDSRIAEIIWDRRFRERRTRAVWRPPDRTRRRGQERRSLPPSSWEREGYVLVAGGAARPVGEGGD